MTGRRPRDPGAPTLEAAGVSRRTADRFLRAVAPLLEATDPDSRRLDVASFCEAIDLGGGLALVATTDGVGTKRALMGERLADLGRDLVAYNVNDVATAGVRPLAFLDYLSCGELDPGRAGAIVEGIAAACREAGCVLLGGETAEHPGIQAPGEIDLAGFAIGVGRTDELVTGAAVRAGDAIVGVASSGPHASGFSLIRHLFDRAGRRVPDSFLAPTPVYVGAVTAVMDRCDVRAMANVCDGGLTENLPRALPDPLGARVRPGAWPRPAWVDELAGLGCAEDELRRVVNMGVGYAFVVPPGDAEEAVAAVEGAGHSAWAIGEVAEDAGPERSAYDA